MSLVVGAKLLLNLDKYLCGVDQNYSMLFDLAGQCVEGHGGGTAHELTDRGEILSCLSSKVKKSIASASEFPANFLTNVLQTASLLLAVGARLHIHGTYRET